MDIVSIDGEEILTNRYMQDSFTLLQSDEKDSWHKMEETQVASKLYRMCLPVHYKSSHFWNTLQNYQGKDI